MSYRSRRMLLTPVCAALAVLCVGCGGPSTQSAVDNAPSPAPPTAAPTRSSTPRQPAAPVGHRITSTFFGMHDGQVAQGIAPDAPIGALRLWDTGTSWRDLEKSPGHFDWTTLDTTVATARRMHARPLLVLGQTPAFYASQPHQQAAYGPGAASMPDLAAWRRYVSAVAARYGDRIDYEIWNEADVVGYWTGTPEQMAQLTTTASHAIRAIAPRATVVSPSFVLRLPSQRDDFEAYWALQSKRNDLAAAVDAVSVHLYPAAEGQPEDEVAIADGARKVLADHGVHLPLWNTEINYGLLGGPEPPPIPAERQRAFLIRTYLLNAGMGVPRVYWYRWDLHSVANTLLVEGDLTTETLAGRSFALVRDWLAGTRVEECRQGVAGAGVWECVAHKGPQVRTFLWKPRGRPTRASAQGATSWTDASGGVTRCHQACRVPVGPAPVMVVDARADRPAIHVR